MRRKPRTLEERMREAEKYPLTWVNIIGMTIFLFLILSAFNKCK